MKIKKFFALFLSVCLIVSACFSASATEPTHNLSNLHTTVELFEGESSTIRAPITSVILGKPEPTNINGIQRMVLPYYINNVPVSLGGGYYIYINVELSVVENLENYSGFELVGVRPAEVVDFVGFYDIDDTASVVSVEFFDARQTVNIYFQFTTKASPVDNKDTVTADVTISFLD